MGRSRSGQGGRVESGGGEMESRRRTKSITAECSRSPVGIWEGGSLGGVVCKGTRASATWASYSSLLLLAEQSPSLHPPLLISILLRCRARETFPGPHTPQCFIVIRLNFFFLFASRIYWMHMARAHPVYCLSCPSAHG